MRYLTIVLIALLCITTVFAQITELPHSFAKQPNFRFHKIDETRYRLIDDLSKTFREKDLGEFTTKSLNKLHGAIDSTVIVVKDLDTSMYTGKFIFWQDVDADNGSRAPFVGDINKNGKAEIYGSVITFDHVPTFETVGPLAYYELQSDGKFTKKFQFPYPRREIFAKGIVDLDNDDINELHVRSTDSLKPPWDTLSQYAIISKDLFMKQPDDTSLAIQHFFKWPKDTSFLSQRDDYAWGDFDKDGNKEVVFVYRDTLVILEYNSATKNLDVIYTFAPRTHTRGYSIGDFDNDGKTDIVMGSIGGKVFVVENIGDNTYQNVWTGTVETNNAYLHFWTNDIDGNGKNEFWVGGDGFFSGVGKTRFTCFESTDDNSYAPVAIIDFVGVFSFYAGNTVVIDIDNTGKEEIGICMDAGFYLLKFDGSAGKHSYKLIFVKTSEFSDFLNYPGLIHGGTLYDVDGDGKSELLITHELVRTDINRIHIFVRIYKQYLPLSSKEKEQMQIPFSYELYQNYPNPFNASTTILYRLSEKEYVTLKIYSILGKEIKTLVEKEQVSGEHRIHWNAQDNYGRDVGSGIYFVRLQTNNFFDVKKIILIK